MAETIQVVKPKVVENANSFKVLIEARKAERVALSIEKSSRNVQKSNRRISLSSVYATQLLDLAGIEFAKIADISEKSQYLDAVDDVLSVVCENAVVQFLKQK